MRTFISIFFALFALTSVAQFKNFNGKKEQAIRFDLAGNAIDAHDGEIAQFNGVYYLYGTSYDCGYEWNNKDAPFCGFKVYSSKDLDSWKDLGYLFDAKTPLWQSRCNGSTYGCYRPHVVYNSRTKKYVLWINVYDNVIGYRVFTADKPEGPFNEVAEPKLSVNNDKPERGLNNGDHDLFVDDDGTCYLAFTDWRAKGAIAIEKLTPDYLSGTGEAVTGVTPSTTEAPGLFKRKKIYYITYSDPNCGYCSGTGTSYRTATSPLGPWSEPIKISENSCGGQPSFVSTVKIDNEVVYIYGSDLWNNAARNEALANFYWAPLQFEKDGKIKPLECYNSYDQYRPKSNFPPNPVSHKWVCGITDSTTISAYFHPAELKSKMEVLTFKNHYPDAPLTAELFAGPSEKPIATAQLDATQLGWSPAMETIDFNTSLPPLDPNLRYRIVLSTRSKKGCYGFAMSDWGTVLIK